MSFPLLDTSFFGEQRRIISLESSKKYQLPEAQSSAIWFTESSENMSNSGSVQLEDGLSTDVQSITEDDLWHFKVIIIMYVLALHCSHPLTLCFMLVHSSEWRPDVIGFFK